MEFVTKDLFSEWQSSTLGLIDEIESLLARLEDVRLGDDSRRRVAAVRQMTAFFIADRSLGVHNSVLTEEQLSRVLADLKKLLPQS